jgi:murein DD-endopeptidase MepM/ murein hydrolase activator NlpD
MPTASDNGAARGRTRTETRTAPMKALAMVGVLALATLAGAAAPAHGQTTGDASRDAAVRAQAGEAVERAARIGVLFDSPDAAAQLRVGVLRHLIEPAPLPPPTTMVPNPETLDMSGAWDGEAGGEALNATLAAQVVDLARRSGIAVGPLRTGRSTTTTSTTTSTTPENVSASAGGRAVGGLVCPVAGPVRFINDWGFPRSGGRNHRGNDLFADEGAPIVAVRDAVITSVSRVDRGLGGLTVSYIDDRGDRWYNAHLSAVAAGIDTGVLVTQGQVVGYVGRTGNARTTPPHNHIQWHPGNGDPINPYWSLRPAC